MTPVVEIDIPYCSLTYGVAPCTAEVGVTGTRKCFNLIRVCQDRANFTSGIKTLRFCSPSEEARFTKGGDPVTVIPSIQSLSITPAVIHPGVDIGQRESVRIVFRDHPHSDAGIDKYLADRDYDAFERGTFWGRLRARVFSLEGASIRVLRGESSELDELTTYHYVVDTLTGQSESVTLVAKDPLILGDKKKAQAPLMSNGVLVANLSAGVTSATLSPAGIGDAEYPTDGKVAIGGKEVCAFTRSGDTLTLTRGQSGTEDQDHDEGDRVQVVLEYSGESPANIVADLLASYTPGIDPEWISLAEWQIEADEFIDRLYSADIAEPTSVSDLLNELIEQVGLVFWWDAVNQKIRLQSLRPVADTASLYDEGRIAAGTFRATEQPQTRISEMWTYYGLKNPLEPIDEPSNYRAAILTVDANSSVDYLTPAVKKVFSRWISNNNRAAAARLNAMLLSRYRDAPRKFEFEVFRNGDLVPALGAGLRIRDWALQDDTGDAAEVAAQFVSVEPREDVFIVDAQESIFYDQEEIETTRLIYIDSSQFNVNLRTVHDQIYTEPSAYDQVRCIVAEDVIVGSNNSQPAFVVGDWPDQVIIEIVILGRFEGRGGSGGSLMSANGEAGGTAFYTRYPVTVTANEIWGGGGGGGGGGWALGGGGGAGYAPGNGGHPNGIPGTTEAGGSGGGAGGAGGNGGGPGEAGSTGLVGTGGAAGIAVDGDSYVTFLEEGDIRGARVN